MNQTELALLGFDDDACLMLTQRAFESAPLLSDSLRLDARKRH